ncbi:hypothetical protein QR680_017714 [Steinernema hermaphroditum]|uniref:DNA-(apurinic or apyrimidinic site) lyase n=1 Tax=Steinernema hermaphroditum TaxID=289476 RepID=A0AA39HGI2_9BILA|nr:hypothetical protein QR680_017714 [Steinernema hermaphroditum]
MTLVLVMGLPGSGKTTLSNQLRRRLCDRVGSVQVFSFDDFILSSGAVNDGGKFSEKANVLRKAWQRGVQSAVESLVEEGQQRFIVLLDDVFYFGSMRRTFERMARAYGLACLRVFVECAVEEAIARNRIRPKRVFDVSEEQIRQIAERIELPFTSQGFVRFCGDEELLFWLILEAKSSPHKRIVDAEPVPDNSVWKQLDLDLRKAVTALLQAEKSLDGSIISARKKCIFEKMKTEGIMILWVKHDDDSVVGVAWNRVWRIRRIDEKHIEYDVLGRFSRASGDDEHVLKDYLQLDINLQRLYREWTEKDKHFASLVKSNADKLEGIRILRQQFLETLFAFICSANNNIQRISKLVNTLCSLYGEKIELLTGEIFYDFPHLDALTNVDSEGMEAVLRKNAFGYRAGYIARSVAFLLENGGEEWLGRVSRMSTEEARESLMLLPGIGRKVADCICLMALQKHEIVPVDTHVMQITASLYIPSLAPKNGKKAALNDKNHKEIGDFYLELFGPYAGWAHSVLFSSRLKHISPGKITKKPR